MPTDHELQRLKHLQAEAMGILGKLYPDCAAPCPECRCPGAYVHAETGAVHCAFCHLEFDGSVRLAE